MAGEITKRDQPTQQTFIDQHVPAPFVELGQLGQQLAKEKSVKRAALKNVSDNLLGIKATDEDRATRDRIIGDFKKQISEISKSPARNQEAEINQLADSIAHEVNFGNLSTIKDNFATDIENRKQETALRTQQGGKLFDEQFSLGPVNKAFEETYGRKKDFLPDSSNLDEEGNVKFRQNVLPRAHHDVNAFFTPIFAKIKPNLLQTAKEDKEKGLITTTKTGGINDKRIYGAAFNQVASGLVPSFIEDQMREEIGQLSPDKVQEMAERAVNNIPFEQGEDPKQIIESATPDELLDFAMIDRIASVGHNQIHRIQITTKKGFGKGGLQFNFGGGGRANTKDFNFTAKKIKGQIGEARLFKSVNEAPDIVAARDVNLFDEILISKTGKGGASKNQIISVQDPENPKSTVDVRPISFRRPSGSTNWFLFGEREIDKPADKLTSKEEQKIRNGGRVTIKVQELFPYEDVKENFANNYGNIFINDLNPEELFNELEEEKPAEIVSKEIAPAKESIKITGKINPSELVVDQLYEINGRKGKWNGTNFVPVE